MSNVLFKDKLLTRFTTPDCLGNNLMTPLCVSKESKTLFFHIAKTGGSSVASLLRANNLDDGVLSDKHLSLDDKVSYFSDVADEWESYYKFTFTRNKYDLLVSLYNMDVRLNGNFSLDSSVTFEGFIREYVRCKNTLKNEGLYNEMIDQYYLTHLDGELLYDFVGSLENFDVDLDMVCDRLGIKNTHYRENVGTYDKSKKDSFYTEELREIVRAKFPQEFNHFGW
tara:strand:- start:733 stop:1407 length:675 start_codon:yes stop_codon:yes gene_type:complete